MKLTCKKFIFRKMKYRMFYSQQMLSSSSQTVFINRISLFMSGLNHLEMKKFRCGLHYLLKHFNGKKKRIRKENN